MANSAIHIGQLSENQQEALQQYTAVTNQAVEAAIPLLQRSQWNIQIAIAKFFDGEQTDPVAEALAAQNAVPPRTTRQENLQESLLRGSSLFSGPENRLDPAPRILPQNDDQIIRRPPILLAIVFAPFSLVYKILSSSFSLLAYLFPFLPRLLHSRTTSRSSRMSNTSGRRSLTPRDNAARFKREFEEEYGPHELPFFDGGYTQAFDVAQKELKFLLVVLMSPEHDGNTTFTHETLLSPEVTTFINDPKNSLILWGGNVQDSEAYQVSNSMRCTKFPFSALIALNPNQSSTSMSVIGRLVGHLSASTYVAKLQSLIASHSEQLATVRAQRTTQEFERTLRQEQNSAYERSLAQDRERTRRRREAEVAAAATARKVQEDAAAAKKYATNLRQWKVWRSSTIAAEPGPEVTDAVQLVLRMPERIKRRFKVDTTIEELYAFVECYDVLNEGSSVEQVSKPTDFDPTYRFRLVSAVPRVVYGLEEGGTILGRVGKNVILMVEPIQEDEDE